MLGVLGTGIGRLGHPLVGKWGGGGAAPSISDQTIAYGALTLASAGGARALDDDGDEVDFVSVDSVVSGTGTGWTVSSGRLIRSTGTPAASNGAILRCTTSLGQIDVTIDASDSNSYSVASNSEITSVLAISVATLAGKTVKLRKGNYTAISISSKAYGSTTTFGAHTALDPVVASVTVTSSTNVVIDGLTVTDATITNSAGLVTITGTSDTVMVQNCEIYGNVLDHAADYSSGAYPGNANGVVRGGSSSPANVAVLNNYIHDVEEGIVFGNCTGNFEASGNHIAYTYEDCIKVGRVSDFGSYTRINDNYMHGGLAVGTDVGNPHKDMIQFLGSALTADWTGIEVYRNIGICEERGSAQLVFADDATSGIFFSGMKVKGNLMLTKNSVHGCYINRAKACEVINNTFAKQDPTAGQSNTVRINIGVNESSGVHKVWQNLTEGYTVAGSPSMQNNITLGLNGATIPYGTAMVGPTFNAVTRAEILSKYAMKANGPADIDNSGNASTFDAGAAGSGYVTWPTTVPGNNGSLNAAYEAGGDSTAPVLSSPSGTKTGKTTADLAVTTNEANGTLYAVVTTSATPPSAAQVKAGQNNGGTSAVYAGNQSIASTGAKTFSATGLSAITRYYAYFMHEDAAANQSTVSAASAFITDPNVVDNNGTASFTTAAGPANDAQGTWFFRFTPQTHIAGAKLYDTASRSEIQIGASGVLRVIIKDSANTLVYDAVSGSNAVQTGVPCTLYVAVDLSGTPSISIKINGSDVSMTPTQALIAGSGLIGHNRASGYLGSDVGTLLADVQISQYFFDGTQVVPYASFHDGSGGPIDLAGVGSPYVRLGSAQTADERSGNSSQGWNDGYNLGSGGALTVVSATFTDV